MSERVQFGVNAIAIFSHGSFTFALNSVSKKKIDTLQRLEAASGVVEEVKLHTLAKNSASKLPDLRQDFAWFTTATQDENGNQEQISFFMHGGSI